MKTVAVIIAVISIGLVIGGFARYGFDSPHDNEAPVVAPSADVSTINTALIEGQVQTFLYDAAIANVKNGTAYLDLASLEIGPIDCVQSSDGYKCLATVTDDISTFDISVAVTCDRTTGECLAESDGMPYNERATPQSTNATATEEIPPGQTDDRPGI